MIRCLIFISLICCSCQERNNEVAPPDSKATTDHDPDMTELYDRFISGFSEEEMSMFKQRRIIEYDNNVPIVSTESAHDVFQDYYRQVQECRTGSNQGLTAVRVSGDYFYAMFKGESWFIVVERGGTQVFDGGIAVH